MIPWNSPINLRGKLADVDGSPAGYTYHIEKWPANEHTYLGFIQLSWHLERKLKQLCNLGNELPLFRNNNIVNLGTWLNLMLVIFASVSKPANSSDITKGDYGTPTIITLLANQHIF